MKLVLFSIRHSKGDNVNMSTQETEESLTQKQKWYFTEVVHRLFKEEQKFSMTQLFQLRFITAVIMENRCKIEDLPQYEDLDTIIAEWESKGIINLQESLMKKRDDNNLNIISKTERINLEESRTFDGLIKLNDILCDYECQNTERCKEQKECFEELAYRLYDTKGRYELEQFYQLRFITAVIIKTGKSKIKKIPLGKSPEQILSEWEGSNIIGLQEKPMRERDELNFNTICGMLSMDLKEMSFDTLLDANSMLGYYGKMESLSLPKDSYFEKVAYRLSGTKSNLKHFYQLRFITAVIKSKRYKLEDLSRVTDLDKIIEEWQRIGLVESSEANNLKDADSKKLTEIFKVYLGEEACAKINRKGSYKLTVSMMIGFNELLNSYSEKWSRTIRQGKSEQVHFKLISDVYQILDEWASDKECPLSTSDVLVCYEKMFYTSRSLISRELRGLRYEIVSDIRLGEDNKKDGANVILNKIILEELKQCRQKIRQRCDSEFGDKRPKIYIDVEEDENPSAK